MKVRAGPLFSVTCVVAFTLISEDWVRAELARNRRPSHGPAKGHRTRAAVPCPAVAGVVDPPTAEVNDASNDTLAGANAAGTMYFSGTIRSNSDLDMYRFCAAAGDAISVRVDGSARRDLTPWKPDAHLFDGAGAELTEFAGIWTARYTGAYYAGVGHDAVGRPGDYLFAIGVNCQTGAEQTVDLGVTHSGAPDPVTTGNELVYTATITNGGPDVALDATMEDPLPAGTAFQSIAGGGSGGEWSCALPVVGTSGTISCTNGCFPSGGSFTFTITVTVDPCIGDTTLTNSVTASSLTGDSDASNNAAATTVTVVDPGTCDDGNVCTTGDQCGAASGSTEDFDLVQRPFLPHGWDSFLSVGPPGAIAWRTVATVADTAPNSVFAPDAPDVRDYVLDSPSIRIQTPTTMLTFKNRYSLEGGFDGGVLEIKIGFGPFEDILTAGGSFETGGYDGTISNFFLSPIAGRKAWTGTTPGFVTTVVNLPAAADGRLVVLRWRMATDQSRGTSGQWIDSVAITDASICRPGASIDCDDDDPCTADSCDPLLGCRHAANSCDDGNACTRMDLCQAGACVGSNPVVCSADDSCHDAGVCDPGTGVCSTVSKPDGSACDDGDACTTNDACGGGTCRGGPEILCDDENLCTDDSCDAATGCAFATNTMSCNDGNACTTIDACSSGACVGTTPVGCGAPDPCHLTGVCNPETGACSYPAKPDGATCDDGDPCTMGETCRLGTCTPAFSGLDEPAPRTNGYYKGLCHGPRSGDRLTDADAVCVGGLTATFAGLSTVGQICDVIEPSHPNNDACDRTEDDLMVLALNICRARVCIASGIASQCGDNTTVGQSLAESDAILASPSRNFATCSHAKCLDEEINTGRALRRSS